MAKGENAWKHCSTCGKDIAFGRPYWKCSVSTCAKGPKAKTYCSVYCWDIHLPVANHREAWAEECCAPSREESLQQVDERGEARLPRRRIVGQNPKSESSKESVKPNDILIVASKLKSYIKAKAGLNTSNGVKERLSDMVRRSCDQAIDECHKAGRKTVLDRDFK